MLKGSGSSESSLFKIPHPVLMVCCSYAILEYEVLIDSAEVELSDWVRIASDIELNYHLFDSFVILHGTDTMAYTASALSFLLEDLG